MMRLKNICLRAFILIFAVLLFRSTASRAVTFAFEQGSVYPRVITPNGDGINDVVFFYLENVTSASFKGTVYDLQAQKVADLREGSLFVVDHTILVWDGKDDSGATVPGGIYIYKIEVADRMITGTVGVAR